MTFKPQRKIDAAVVKAAEAMQLRLDCRANLTKYAETVLKPLGMEPARHHRFLLAELQKLTDEPNYDRLLITMPPGFAKSTYASVIFPSWWIASHPNRNILAVSYGSELSEKFSLMTREYISENSSLLGYKFDDKSNARDNWSTTNGCSYRATGVGGAITGFRADMILVDDPIKSRVEAGSIICRQQLWEWYSTVLFTRMKPGGKMALIMTRWDVDDVAGRLLEAEPGRWKVIAMPAICDTEDDPLGREIGEHLWPSYMSESFIEDRRNVLTSRDFAALYQCRPTVEDGNLFKPEKFKVIEETQVPSDYAKVIRAWDFASSTSAKADFTVGTKMMRTKDNRYIITDIVRIKAAPEDVIAKVKQTAYLDGRAVVQSIPIDPGAAGMGQAQYITKELAGYQVHSSRESGSKETRALPLVSQVNVGNVSLVNSNLIPTIKEEFGSFPGGRHDDIVDATSRAFSQICILPQSSRFGYMNRLGR